MVCVGGTGTGLDGAFRTADGECSGKRGSRAESTVFSAVDGEGDDAVNVGGGGT